MLYQQKNRLPAALLALLALVAGSAGAQPVISVPDPDAYFDLQPTDCPSCTPAEQAELGQGLRLLLTRLRQGTLNPDGRLCGGEAGISREMAVLTYDLVRQGAISSLRWRDYLRARGQIAGLSEVTREEMLLAYLERVAEQAGGELDPDSLLGRQIRIHGAAQLSRLFFQMATGEWSAQEWAAALASTEGGFNAQVDAVLAITEPGREALDKVLVNWNPQHAWIDGQLAHLSHLPEDFRVGSVPTQRDAIREAYRAEMESRLFGTFYFLEGGCGWELVYTWREEAVRSTEGLDFAADKFIRVPLFLGIPLLFEEITVVGEPGGISPFPGSNGNPSVPHGPGPSGPSTPQPTTPTNPDEVTGYAEPSPCRQLEAGFMTMILQRDFCPVADEVRQYLNSNPMCPLSPRARATLEATGCTAHIEVEFCMPLRPDDPRFCEFCVRFCYKTGGGYGGYSVTTSGALGLPPALGLGVSMTCNCTPNGPPEP